MSTSLLLRSSLSRHISSSVATRAAAVHRFRNSSTTAAPADTAEFKYVPGGRKSTNLSIALASEFLFLCLAIYPGTVNDPTTFPTPSKSHGSHHWAFERLLAASLLPLTGAAFVTSGTAYPVLDGILGVTLIMHSHIGVCYFLLLGGFY